MGCCKFRNYTHLLQVSYDSKWLDGGEFPLSLGSYATIRKANSGCLVNHRKYKYLNAVHLDIAFGDCLSIGSFHYALILVDHAMWCSWAFGFKNLSSNAILAAIQLFHAVAGYLAKFFYCICDIKLFGTAISKYLINNTSKVIMAHAKWQTSNGWVKLHWKTMVHMACAYLTEKQMPHTFWLYAITHSAWIIIVIPRMYMDHIALPFLLVHRVCHDEWTWIPLFSLCYFHHNKDSNQQCSKHQVHTSGSIVIGCSPTLNALLVYNPCNPQYYEPGSYHIDPYHLPTSIYPNIKYDGGLFCHLLLGKNPHMEEKYPPGTHIEHVDPSTNMLLPGTAMDIPFPATSADSPLWDPLCMVLFDNGSTASIPLQDMASLIPPPPVGPSINDSLMSQDSLLSPFLCLNSKITYDHDRQYHKGFLMKCNGCYWFSFKSHVNKKQEEWGIDLPNLVINVSTN